MDTTPIVSQSAPAPAPAVAPVAPAPVAAPVAPAPAPAPASYSNGGDTGSGSSGFKDFFDGINLLDMGFMILGTAALVYHIYYVRQNIKFRKSEYIDLSNRLDKQEAQLSAIKTNTAKTAAAAGKSYAASGQGIRQRFR
jgi:hypothetical protein